MLSRATRERVVHAAALGSLAAGVAAAAQYFIAIPTGSQPSWLGFLATVTAAPADYFLFPLASPLEWFVGHRVPNGMLMEVSTPFGGAMRAGIDEIGLVALGTLVMVALVDYLAKGVEDMLQRNRIR